EAQQQLASPDLDPKACTAVLAEAEDAAERIATIVDSLRQLSRAKEAQETVSFVETVRSAIDMTAHQAQHRAVVSHDLETDAAVLANHARLAQVFVNLVMNAVHALPEDGEDNRIEVRAFERERDGQRWVVAEVEDNGAGMAPETLRRIFDPFFTTKPVGVGTGLGLSICQDTVEGLGGRLEAESTLGRGTVMRVILPAAEAAPESTERPRARPVASNDHRMTVLVVDDEKLLLHAIRRALKPHCEVQTARDAQTALKLLDEGLRPDVILTDLMMPRMSGMQLHQEVAGRYPELASTMLFMSGGAFSPESQRFCDSMGERVLAKPLRMAEVVEAILGVDPSPPPHRARA
ncbi:MAG: hybrid sensor histidine kinase/response regulator, partial [Myxococcales bacterium]|nr:hybrid sensor histidine kinase/response regulator [Myxococcales bacterium]